MMDDTVHPDAREWRFDELVREGVAVLPALAPEWTDHNASDPGITLIELLAYFSEVLAWRALRITPDARLNLLRLLMGSGWTGWQALIGQAPERLDAALRSAIERMAHPECLASLADFEQAAVQACREELQTEAPVRALALAGIDLRRRPCGRLPGDQPDALAEAAGDVSVVLAPDFELPADRVAPLCDAVQRRLVGRCQLTSRVHVVAPMPLQAFVSCRIALQTGQQLHEVRARIVAALVQRFGPGADDAAGPAAARPFGQPLFISEVIGVLGQVAGVDWVDRVQIRALSQHGSAYDEPGAEVGLRIGQLATIGRHTRLGGAASVPVRRFVRDETGEPVALQLQPWETVRVRLAPDAVQAVPSSERRR